MMITLKEMEEWGGGGEKGTIMQSLKIVQNIRVNRGDFIFKDAG
mgnify:CR=1 FL=1